MTSSKFRLLLPALLSLCLPVLAQSAQPANRIVAQIDDSNRVALQGNVHPMAQARFDRGPASLSMPTGRISLVLQRSAAQQQALTQYLADLQNPGSPNYHKWLTPAQYGAQFGISDSDLATVESWLQAQGFKIERVPEARNLIQFSGTFGQIQQAFHTSIHIFQVKGVSHFANTSDPQIPAALAPVIAGIAPLNDFRPKPGVVQGPRSHYSTAEHRIQPDLTLQDQNNNNYLVVDPADAATIYDAPNSVLNASYSGTKYDGTGVKLGIVGVSNIEIQDIVNYRTAFLGEASGSVNKPTVIVDGDDPGVQPGGSAVEALLDNEVAGGLAPGATIYFYTSADTDISSGLFNAIARAVNDNAVSILSVSFGACEQGLGSAANTLINEIAEQASAEGISLVASTGDGGSAGCDDFDTQTAAQHGLAVSGFASTPYNIAVGGTDFDVLSTSMSTYVNTATYGSAPYYGTAKGFIPEATWNDSTTVNTTYSANVAAKDSNGNTNIVAGSGGVSSIYAKPSFQSGLTTDTFRDIPDVSLFAADGFHFAFWALCSDSISDGTSSTYTPDCQNSSGNFTSATTFSGAGGTSAAAPAFAGILALISQSQSGARLGQADYVLYQVAKSHASAFHDVTTGNNSVPCITNTPNCGTNNFLTGYNTGGGYDLATGLGSVDVSALISAWSSATLTSTSTTLNINGSTAAYTGTHGASLTFNVGVTPTSATGVAAIVSNANETTGGTTAGPQNNGQIAVPLTSGSGSVAYNGLPGGSYTVWARYGGDTSNAASQSAAINVTIAAEPSTTTLGINAYNPQTGGTISSTNAPYGSEVLLDATITGTAEGSKTEGVATGTVTFSNGATQLGSAKVSTGNLASYPPFSSSFVAFAPGTYNVTAAYSGDVSYNASTSSVVSFSVSKAPTTTGASANPTSVGTSSSTTVTGTITTPWNAGVPPTGSIAFTIGGTSLTTINSFTSKLQLSGNTYYWVLTGTGTISGSKLPTGSDTVTATYSGDTNYATSSTTLALTVTSGSSAGITLSNTGNITVTHGAVSGNTTTINVTSNGFTGQVNLSCAVTTSLSSPNDPPTCSVTTPVTLSASATATATLTANTIGSTAALDRPLERFFLGGGATLAMLLFFGIPARRRAWRGMLTLVAVLFIGAAIGCGGGSGSGTKGGGNPGTTAGAYTITVTGTDAATGKVTATTTISLTVN